MKEATGDMTMTIVVIVSVIAVLTIGYLVWPILQNKILHDIGTIDDEVSYVIDVKSYDI